MLDLVFKESVSESIRTWPPLVWSRKNPRKAVLIGAVLALVLIEASPSYKLIFPGRYHVESPRGSLLIKVDRWTGQTWIYQGGAWRLIKHTSQPH